MNIPSLKSDCLPADLRQSLIEAGVILEITETKSNGRSLKDLRVVFGDFDLGALSESERLVLLTGHEAGLYAAEQPPESAPAVLSRAQFEALDAGARHAYMRDVGALVD